MREGWQTKELVKFTLPSVPKSVNSLYQINFSQRRTYLNPDAAMWKTQMKMMVPRIKEALTDGTYIKVDRTYCYNFFHKNSNLKKMDSCNFDKLLLDTISEKTGIDDSLFKFGSIESYNDKECVEIVISKVWKEEPPSASR